MDLIRYTGPSSEGGNDLMLDGLHLPGLDEHDSETLCGACWSEAPRETIDGQAPTCKRCISAAREILKRYTKKQALAW